MRVALNGTTIIDSQGQTENSTPTQMMSITDVVVTTGDIITAQVANLSDTSNINHDIIKIIIVG